MEEVHTYPDTGLKIYALPGVLTHMSHLEVKVMDLKKKMFKMFKIFIKVLEAKPDQASYAVL